MKLQPLYRVLVQERFQRLGLGGVVVVQQRFVELLHVLIADGQNARTSLQQDLVCQCQAGALVAVPEKLPACAPAEGRQRLFCCRSIGGKDRAASSARTAASCGTGGV